MLRGRRSTFARPGADFVAGAALWQGRKKITQAYSNDAPEFINACSELKKQNNSLAERANQCIVDQATACLAHAGRSARYWAHATTTLCHLMNIEEIDGSSAWFCLRGERFRGEKIPSGALVGFKTSDATSSNRLVRKEKRILRRRKMTLVAQRTQRRLRVQRSKLRAEGE